MSRVQTFVPAATLRKIVAEYHRGDSIRTVAARHQMSYGMCRSRLLQQGVTLRNNLAWQDRPTARPTRRNPHRNGLDPA